MSTAFFEVSGVRLIPQRFGMSCWYASARMLIDWRTNKINQMTAMTPPELDWRSATVRDANNGIVNAEILGLAKRLGLTAVPPMTPTPEAIGQWLRSYGPLWVNGRSHIVVIAGINGRLVKVFDPWPVNIGKVEWRSLDNWYYNGASVDSPDTSHGVQAVFLHS